MANFTKAEVDLKYGSMSYRDVLISHEEYLGGKYKHVSHVNGEHYARISYRGDTIHPEETYTDRYCREHKLGKYAEKSGSGTSAPSARQPKTFAGKLGSVLGHFALAAVADGIEKASANGTPKPKKVLPKPKSARPASTSATSSSGGLKSLLSEKKGGLLKKARPAAAESRTGLLGRLKSGTAKKGGLLGGGSKTSVAPKKGGLLGGGSKASAAPKKGGLLGGGTKSAAPKKGGLLGGGTKTAAPKKGGLLGGGSKASAAPKKGGLLGGGMKKASGMSLGKKRR